MKNQEIIWGCDVRYMMDKIQNSAVRHVRPDAAATITLLSGFIQDDLTSSAIGCT